MKKLTRCLWFTMLLIPALGLAQEADDDDGYAEDDDRVVQAAAVPAQVMSTARSARPNAYFMRITQKLDEDDDTYYVFNASQVGKYWVVTVRADGELMSVNEESEAPNLSSD